MSVHGCQVVSRDDRAFLITTKCICSVAQRHVHTTPASFLQSPEDSSLQVLTPLTFVALWSDLVSTGQFNRSYYLFTYLFTYKE